LVYTSSATDLTSENTGGHANLFLYDLARKKNTLINTSISGNFASEYRVSQPFFSPDGRYLAFISFASDLAEGDVNGAEDIFVVRLEGEDQDGDELEDDWEMTYFGNLERNGQGDADHDGVTDLAEYQAGTNPVDGSSYLQATLLRSVFVGETLIQWQAVRGRSYRVQYKDDVDASAWSEFPETIKANSANASVRDANPARQTHRFYRIKLLD